MQGAIAAYNLQMEIRLGCTYQVTSKAQRAMNLQQGS